MGLLDDAIREHLELKRLRGADPSDVARAEREVLTPVGQEEHALEEPRPHTAEEAVAKDEERFEPDHLDHAEHGHETVELDMSAVLNDPQPGDELAGGPPLAEPRPEDDAPPHGDSLEWEMPAGQGESATGEPEQAHGDAEKPEDVLEETPDFLRETPEQERLWFEQRPPRDFDFNE